jgi:hypothetical protein
MLIIRLASAPYSVAQIPVSIAVNVALCRKGRIGRLLFATMSFLPSSMKRPYDAMMAQEANKLSADKEFRTTSIPRLFVMRRMLSAKAVFRL